MKVTNVSPQTVTCEYYEVYKLFVSTSFFLSEGRFLESGSSFFDVFAFGLSSVFLSSS